MKYRYRAVERFWDELLTVCLLLKRNLRAKTWKTFKEDPFDPRLRTHKIQRAFSELRPRFTPLEMKGDCAAVLSDGENRSSLWLSARMTLQR